MKLLRTDLWVSPLTARPLDLVQQEQSNQFLPHSGVISFTTRGGASAVAYAMFHYRRDRAHPTVIVLTEFKDSGHGVEQLLPSIPGGTKTFGKVGRCRWVGGGRSLGIPADGGALNEDGDVFGIADGGPNGENTWDGDTSSPRWAKIQAQHFMATLPNNSAPGF